MQIHVTDQAGVRHTLEALEGWRVMEVIRDWGLNIKAECGGACACATCHIYVPNEWAGRCGTADELETNILDFAFDVQPTSRLACQINVTDDLDGLLVRMPARQY